MPAGDGPSVLPEAGARWLHVVDLDGAKAAKPLNDSTIFEIVKGHPDARGGGRRYPRHEHRGALPAKRRCPESSWALPRCAVPEFVKEAVQKYGKKIAVGIDARDGKVAAEGWLETSDVDYLEMAKRMEDIGVRYLIVTDISRDGTLKRPQPGDAGQDQQRGFLQHHRQRRREQPQGHHRPPRAEPVRRHLWESPLYAGALDLKTAVLAAHRISGKHMHSEEAMDDFVEHYFQKGDLIPAVVQEAATGEILMLAYMNRESLKAHLCSTGYTWFYSRSRQTLWNKGATSGHVQKVVSIHADCDDDALVVKVIQTGNACHTGSHSCFFKNIWNQ